MILHVLSCPSSVIAPLPLFNTSICIVPGSSWHEYPCVFSTTPAAKCCSNQCHVSGCWDAPGTWRRGTGAKHGYDPNLRQSDQKSIAQLVASSCPACESVNPFSNNMTSEANTGQTRWTWKGLKHGMLFTGSRWCSRVGGLQMHPSDWTHGRCVEPTP